MKAKGIRKSRDGHNSADNPGDSNVVESQPTDSIEIPEAEIRERAYEIYVERGGVDGLDEDDWYQAENELRAALKSRRSNPSDT
jgi:hypothetical protein